MSSNNPSDVMDQMVGLRLQRAQIDQQIEKLKPAFHQACTALDVPQLRHKHALISRKLTPGQWQYSDAIQDKEKQLKRLKQQFQETHEPVSGREVRWAIKLA